MATVGKLKVQNSEYDIVERARGFVDELEQRSPNPIASHALPSISLRN